MRFKFSFKDTSVKVKLALVVLIPVMALLTLTVKDVLQSYREIRDLDQVVAGVEFATKTGALVHELQKERGSSVLYLGGKGEGTLAEFLKTQFAETDKRAAVLRTAMDSAGASKIGATPWESLDTARKLLDTMVKRRSELTDLKITQAQVLEYATAAIDAFLAAEARITQQSADPAISPVTRIYTALLAVKEKAGLTRATGVIGFEVGRFTPESFLQFASRVAEMNALAAELLKAASPSQKEEFQKRMETKEAAEFRETIARALQIGPAAQLPISGEEWFRIATKRNNLLKEVENLYAHELEQAASDRKAATLMAAILAAGLAFLLTLIAVVLGIFVYRGLMASVTNLTKMVAHIAQGQYDARAVVLGADEMGMLSMALNQMLDDRMQALAKAEKENEALNNSVIELLKVVYVLSQRDLTARCEVDQTVIGTVADSINQLTMETAKVLGHVSRAARRVSSASGKVKSQASAVHNEAETELQHVDRMTAGIGITVDQVNALAELANNTNKFAEEATASTSEALERVSNTVKGMESIRETIAETEKRVKRLGERSQEISGIVNLINTISERTHVLALNASMQAAIAGEAGRGFAVVAEEVQRLAESSRNATSQIASLVNNIQIETNDTVATVNKTIGQVVSESELAQKAGAQMEKTQRITSQLAEMVQRIAANAQTQAQSAQFLRQQVEQIGTGAKQTLGQITAQTEEAQSLEETAQQLLSAISVFRLPEEFTDKVSDTQSLRRTDTQSLRKAA